MDAAGVGRVVIVPPSIEGTRNDLALAAAQAHPDRFAVMGKISEKDPRSPERLAKWRSQPGMLGLRFNFKRTPGDARKAATPIGCGVLPRKPACRSTSAWRIRTSM